MKRIENKNKKVLEIPEKNKEGNVTEESYDKNKEEQLWKKGKSDDNDYFTLKNKKSSEFLTADSENSFKVKGTNISMYVCNMAFPVVEFSKEGYKIRKVFG